MFSYVKTSHVAFSLALVMAIAGGGSGGRAPHSKVRSIRIEIRRPWYIQFSAVRADGFEPASLVARVHSKGGGLGDNVAFTKSDMDDGLWRNFLNVELLNLHLADKVSVQLKYERRTRARRKEAKLVEFDYIITTKDFDVRDVHLDWIADPQPDSEETSEESEENTNHLEATTIKSDSGPHEANDIDATATVLDECSHHEALLRRVLEIAEVGTHLVLTGIPQRASNASDVIRAFIANELGLPPAAIDVVKAEFTRGRLLFAVGTPRQKLELLTKADEVLKDTPYRIEDIIENVADVSPYLRNNLNNGRPARSTLL